jgi:tetratricopeptide (TPR) repeat protein
MKNGLFLPVIFACLSMSALSCKEQYAGPSKSAIAEIKLKRGEVIACGSGAGEYGELQFRVRGNDRFSKDFNLGVKLLHSFEYDEAEKVFAKIIEGNPVTAMAYWGVAMSNFHPLWTPPTEAELTKGSKALALANSIEEKSAEEVDYINAIGAFYKDWQKTDHHSRCLDFEQAMEKLHNKYPDDKEAATFYALALTAAADPTDQSFAKQKKAGALLTSLYPGQPNHPGIVHYIIHTYDSPKLAELALPAARKYASVAPSSAHALHMPSHIFTRLGLWDESIRSNLASVDNAKCYAKASGIKGHWDEELHGLDYLVDAYLQKGDNVQAKKQLDYLQSMDKVEPVNFKVAYAFAAIPSRYLLENRLWADAAKLEAGDAVVQWKDFPWQKSILHATRMMGAIHTGAAAEATTEMNRLKEIHNALLKQKNIYQARQVEVKIKTGEAWIQLKKGNKPEALRLMAEAADMEDKAEKHPVTPGEVIPAREYLADMLMEINEPAKALGMYETSLDKNQNRFNGLYGAAVAARRAGNKEKAAGYYRKLLNIGNANNSSRVELKEANDFLSKLSLEAVIKRDD